jgi:hypothetical protein
MPVPRIDWFELLFGELPSERRAQIEGVERALDEDRLEEAVSLAARIDARTLGRAELADLVTCELRAHVALGAWAQAESLLEHHAELFLDEETAALWSDARAQVRLGRGDVEGALAVLDAAEPVPAGARAALALTRLRARAARGRDADDVWRRLAELPRATLERLMRRHPREAAAQIAARILSGAAYR